MVAPLQRLDRASNDAGVTVAGVGETRFGGGIGSSVTGPDCGAAGCWPAR